MAFDFLATLQGWIQLNAERHQVFLKLQVSLYEVVYMILQVL